MKLSAQQLVDACQCSRDTAQKWLAPLNAAMDRYEINTPARVAAFLAQVAHESGRFRYVREIWGPTEAQQRYEGRKDLGNTVAGDGFKYRGRGLIQITGRANYQVVGQALGIDAVAHPERLEEPEMAALSAAWFWHRRELNELADTGQFDRITRRINGGTNGLNERRALWASAKIALSGAS